MIIDFTGDIELLYNQENTNSCSSNALASIFNFILKKQGCHFYPISVLFIYYNTRFLMNQSNKDNGSDPLIALEAVKKFGLCPEVMWPLNVKKIYTEPNENCFQFAKEFPFHLEYTSFRISNQNDPIKSCLQYLFNGILLYCSMKRYKNQVLDNYDFVSSVPLNENSWCHAIVMIGIDTINEYAIFLNSHEPDTGFFKMTFEQIKTLNPIEDTIFAVSGFFENINIMNNFKIDAILDFDKTNIISPKILINNNYHKVYYKNFDHVIIGSGITATYLAYKLYNMNHNETILLLDNNDNENILINLSNNKITIDNGLDELFKYYENTENMNYNPILDKIYQKTIQKLVDDYGEKIIDDNFLITLINLFQIQHTNLLSEMFFIQSFLSNEDINFITNLIHVDSNTPFYYFVKNLFFIVNSFQTNKLLLENLILFIENNLVYQKIGDFLFGNQEFNHICLIDASILHKEGNIIIDSRNNKYTSQIYIKSKQIYFCNLNSENNKIRNLQSDYSNCSILFLFLNNSIEFFEPIYNFECGVINYIHDKCIQCKGFSQLFYQKIIIGMSFNIKNNVYYPINHNLKSLFSVIRDNLDVEKWIIYYYPDLIKYQKLASSRCSPSLFDFMNNQLNCKGIEHFVNPNFSPFPLHIEGSLFMIDYFVENITTIGILLSKTMDKNSENLKEMDEIVGNKKYLYYEDNFDIVDEFMNTIDILIICGFESDDLKEYSKIIQKTIDIVKSKHIKGVYLPLICICYGFELLMINEFENIVINKIQHSNKILDLQNCSQGRLSNLASSNTFHNHRFNILYENDLFSKSEYKVIHTFTYENKNYIATIEHKYLPIYGFHWHPFHKKTEFYLENQKFLLH